MRVSVVVAAYNSEGFIARALQSALDQTIGDLEVVVVDDASLDGTAKVVQSYCAMDNRVVLLQQERNRGPSAARNSAISRARGAWIAILDSDDQFEPDRLEKMITLAEKRELDLLADNLMLVGFESGEDLGRAFQDEWMSHDHLLSLRSLLERDWPTKMSCRPFGFAKPIVRRSFLQRSSITYDEDVFSGEDLLFYARSLLSGAKFGVTNEALYRYSIRLGSVSTSRAARVHLCEVNRRISSAVEGIDHELILLLRERHQALWYEVFKWHLLERRLWDAGKAALRAGPSYVLVNGGSFVWRKLSLKKHDKSPGVQSARRADHR